MKPENPQLHLQEPWLRGPIEGVDPLLAPVLYAFQTAREDLARYTEGLTTEQLWARPQGFGSAGFHIRHIGGSTERLMAYLEQRTLTADQLAAIEREHDPGMDRGQLLAEARSIFARSRSNGMPNPPRDSERTSLRRPQAAAHHGNRPADPYCRAHTAPRRPSDQRGQMGGRRSLKM